MDDLHVRRHRKPDELAALLEPHEPYSTFLVSNLLERGSTREVKAWVIERGGDLAAALVLSRACPTRWYVAPYLFDMSEDVVLTAGGLIDKSSGWNVTGPESHVLALLPHVGRQLYATTAPFLHQPAFTENLQEVDASTRAATKDDIDAVVRLYNAFEHISFVPTVPWLRGMLAPLLASGRVVVAEIDGRVAGAAYLDRLSRRYAYWTGLTIDPAFRGRKLSWALLARAWDVTMHLGVGFMSVVNVTNPMRLKEREPASMLRERWAWARLVPPHRFPGHWTLRRLWVRANGPPTAPRRHQGALRDDVQWLEGIEPSDDVGRRLRRRR